MIKKVIRFELPETNSSSSHSIIISKLKNSENFNLEISEDGIINIPDVSGFDFGRSHFQAYNNTLVKIIFAIAIYNCTHELAGTLKFLNNLKHIICSFTGAKDINFHALEKFNEISKEYSSVDDDYFSIYEICEASFGSVDHNSSDLVFEIFENKDSLKNFIFSEDSWLFLGDDGIDMSDHIKQTLNNYYNKSDVEVDDNYATIDFSKYGIGKVDIELPDFYLCNDLSTALSSGKDEFLSNLVFDNDSKELKFIDYSDSLHFSYSTGYPTETSLSFYTIPIGDPQFLTNVPTLVSHQGELYIYFINSIFYKTASTYFIDKRYEDLGLEDLGNCLLNLIEKCKLVEEKDWVKFKVDIHLSKFGKL